MDAENFRIKLSPSHESFGWEFTHSVNVVNDCATSRVRYF